MRHHDELEEDFIRWYRAKGWWVSRRFSLTEETLKELWYEIRSYGH